MVKNYYINNCFDTTNFIITGIITKLSLITIIVIIHLFMNYKFIRHFKFIKDFINLASAYFVNLIYFFRNFEICSVNQVT